MVSNIKSLSKWHFAHNIDKSAPVLEVKTNITFTHSIAKSLIPLTQTLGHF